MSFNQFSINVLETAGPATPSGSAILNSSLSSPLTGSTYCRKYTLNGGGGGNNVTSVCEVKTFISSSVQGGVFVDTNNAYALSLRAKVRVAQHAYGYSQNNYIGLVAYAPTSSNNMGSFLYSGGYELALQEPETGDPQLKIRAGQALNSDFGYFGGNVFNSNVVATCSGSYTRNTWYHIRMDIIPNSLTQKTINAYTSSNNGTTWDLVGTATVSGPGGNYRDSGYCGFTACKATWFYMGGSSSTIDMFIDDFEAYVST